MVETRHLESVQCLKGHRGFESLSLRKILPCSLFSGSAPLATIDDKTLSTASLETLAKDGSSMPKVAICTFTWKQNRGENKKVEDFLRSGLHHCSPRTGHRRRVCHFNGAVYLWNLRFSLRRGWTAGTAFGQSRRGSKSRDCELFAKPPSIDKDQRDCGEAARFERPKSRITQPPKRIGCPHRPIFSFGRRKALRDSRFQGKIGNCRRAGILPNIATIAPFSPIKAGPTRPHRPAKGWIWSDLVSRLKRVIKEKKLLLDDVFKALLGSC